MRILSFVVRLYFSLLLAGMGCYLPILCGQLYASGKAPLFMWLCSPLFMVAIPLVSVGLSYMMVFRSQELFG